MKRFDAWVKTCTTCHSETFARAYLEFIDNGTSHGLDKYDEAHNVVLNWLKQGLSNEGIGVALNISSRSVARHLQRIYQYLGVRSRVEAIVQIHRRARRFST